MSDDDKRPQISGKVTTQKANVELTVRGSSTETSDDISDTFDEKMDTLLSTADAIEAEGDDTSIMHQ